MNKTRTIFLTTLIFIGVMLIFFNTQKQTLLSPEEMELEINDESQNNLSDSPIIEDESITEEITQTVIEVIENAMSFFGEKDLAIVAIGDSLTQGVGDQTNNEGFVGVLEDFLTDKNNSEFEIANFGKRGNRTDHLLNRLDEQKITESIKKADIILITIGANDIMKIVKENFLSLSYDDFTIEQKDYQARLYKIFTTIREKNARAHIYLIGLFNPFEQYFGDIPELDKIIDDWNWIGRQVVNSQNHSTFIPIKDLFQNPEEDLLFDDNFHPNEQGYKLIAERVLQYLKDTYGAPSE